MNTADLIGTWQLDKTIWRDGLESKWPTREAYTFNVDGTVNEVDITNDQYIIKRVEKWVEEYGKIALTYLGRPHYYVRELQPDKLVLEYKASKETLLEFSKVEPVN